MKPHISVVIGTFALVFAGMNGSCAAIAAATERNS